MINTGSITNTTTKNFYTDFDEFRTELARQETNTERVKIPTKDIKFIPIEEKIYLEIDGMTYPVARSAFVSIKGRIEINGKGLLKLPANLLTQVLNNRIKNIKEVQIIIIDGQVRAVFAATKAGYKIMPAEKIVNYLLDISEFRLGNCKFKNAFLTYDLVNLKMLFPQKKEELKFLYSDSLNKSSQEIIPGIQLITSNTGFSSNIINPFWHTKTGDIILAEERIEMQHRGQNNNILNLEQQFPQLFIRLRNSIQLIQNQTRYNVNSPIKVIKAICKKYKISQKDVKKLIEKVEKFPSNIVTGYQITELLIELSNEEKNILKKEYLENKAGKALFEDYRKYDD